MTRRNLLLSAFAAGALGNQRAAAQSSGAAAYSLPPLPYPVDSLEPYIDARTMEIHHDRHHQAYVDNLNKAVANHPELAKLSAEDLLRGFGSLPESIGTAVRNHGGGHANHTLFWHTLKKGGGRPKGEFAKAIGRTFGGLDPLQEKLAAAATGVFGSGWGWLSSDGSGALKVHATANQDSPLMSGSYPLAGIDVWGHAYYLKYQNRRTDYVKAIFNVIDWDYVSERYARMRS